MQTPLEAFVCWFDRVPQTIRKRLAHIFQVCTTEDTARMAAGSGKSLDDFRAWMIRTDFPLRIAARMFYVRSVFDMVIFHHHEISSGPELFSSLPDKVRDISDSHWEKTVSGWQELRQNQLSDTYIHSWTSWMIRIQMEKA